MSDVRASIRDHRLTLNLKKGLLSLLVLRFSSSSNLTADSASVFSAMEVLPACALYLCQQRTF